MGGFGEIVAFGFNEAVDVYRVERQDRGVGQFVKVEGIEPIATVRCRRSPVSGRDVDRARAQGVETSGKLTHAVYTPAGAGIQRGDRLSMGGVSYRVVVGVHPSEASFEKWLVEEMQRAV